MFRPRLFILFLPVLLVACKHPLAIEGQGDIIERLQDLRGCSLDQFNAGLSQCTENNVYQDESVVYQALPRSGWAFSHWDGGCKDAPTAAQCPLEYSGDWAQLWDDNYADVTAPALTAIFVEDPTAPKAISYAASSFGIANNSAYGSYLNSLFFTDGSYRYTALRASSRNYFKRVPAYYSQQPNGLLATGPTFEELGAGGSATAAMGLITLVDTDNSDSDFSVTYLTPKLEEATDAMLTGNYYCGRMGTNGAATYFRAVLGGNGSGLMEILSDRLGFYGQTALSYQVLPDGTTIMDYAGVRLVGSLSADGHVFVASQVQSSAQGLAICIRSSANQTLGTVAASYYGAWMSTQAVAAVTSLLVDITGTTAEAVLVDSYGGRSYSLGANWMLVNYDGKTSTQNSEGAISPDGRVMFLVNTNPSGFPTLVVYTRQLN